MRYVTPVTSVPSATRSVTRGEKRERRVALEHVVPRRTEHRDLAEVVHHPDARRSRPPRPRPRSRADASAARRRRPAMRTTGSAARSAGRPAPRPARPRAARRTRDTCRARCARPSASRTRSNSAVERVALLASAGAPAATAPGRARPCSARGCGPGTRPTGVANTTATRSQGGCGTREVDPVRAAACVRGRACRRRSSAGGPTRVAHDLSSSANASVLAARSSSPSPTIAAQPVARHDLFGDAKCVVRPGRLAGARRSDQDDQARRRQHDVVGRAGHGCSSRDGDAERRQCRADRPVSRTQSGRHRAVFLHSRSYIPDVRTCAGGRGWCG